MMMSSERSSFSQTFNFNDLQKSLPIHQPLLSDSSSLFSMSQSTNLDDVTTLFAVGFPDDMTEREFQNMFIFCQGFEAASLKWHCKDQEDQDFINLNKKQMIGFARFRTRLEALEAIEVLNGKKVDQDKGTVLKAEMAKKNLHIKKVGSSTSTSSSTTSSNIKRYDTFSPLPSDLFQDKEYNDFFGMRSPPIDDLGFSRFKYPHNINNNNNNNNTSHFHLHQQQQQQQHPFPQSLNRSTKLLSPLDDFQYNSFDPNLLLNHNNPADQNPPCNTLYVGNLPPHTSEDELKQLFSVYPGYRRLCFRQKPQGPMCFVEFDDISFASQVLNQLQGHPLSNSVKGGIRLSYSKNPLFIKPNANVKNNWY